MKNVKRYALIAAAVLALILVFIFRGKIMDLLRIIRQKS